MSEYEPRDLRSLALKITGEVAGLLRDLREDPSSVEKTGPDTTRADMEAEAYALELLEAEGLRCLVVTEESGARELGEEELVAVLDPLDGSVNYVLGVPWCSVSLGFANKRRGARLSDVVAGAVHSVFSLDSFSFYRGGGAYVNDARIEQWSVVRSFESTGKFSVAFYVDEPSQLRELGPVLDYVRRRGGALKARCLGSSALELSLVAVGKIGYFADLRGKLRNVDVVVGLGMLRELSGGYIDGSGDELDVGLERVERLRGLIAASLVEEVERLRGILTSRAGGPVA
ncbi:MAG: inositol monophosphatase family protein [Fervidicoccaceae archaeon]